MAEKSLKLAAEWIGDPEARVEPLGEADHDFRILRRDGCPIYVQITEVVQRDFALPGESDSTFWTAGEGGKLVPLDAQLYDAVIVEKISRKLDKYYSKPKNGELWLVIWSVSGFQLGHYIKGGVRHTSPAVSQARSLLMQRGAGPFDRVFYFNLETRPTLIWPMTIEGTD